MIREEADQTSRKSEWRRRGIESLWLLLSFVLHFAFLNPTIIVNKDSFTRYTNIDYMVFMEGAFGMSTPDAGLAFGQVPATSSFLTKPSPYLRSTYRYSPLMAIFTLPNAYLGPSGGKWVFVLFNVLTSYALLRCMRPYKLPLLKKLALSSIWTMNPLMMHLSCRGSSDAVITFLVLATLFCLQESHPIVAGIFFGLSVHTKIYPIIFAVPLLLSLQRSTFPETLWYDCRAGTSLASFRDARVSLRVIGRRWLDTIKLPGVMAWTLVRRLSSEQWLFALVSAATFSLVTAGIYAVYGWSYLYEAYLYHFIRHDHRHNLSPFSTWATLVTPRRTSEAIRPWIFSLEAMKAILLLGNKILPMYLGLRMLSSSIALAMFLQAVTFVIFNGVFTTQYTMWYLSLMPLAIASAKTVRYGDVSLARSYLAMAVGAGLCVVSLGAWIGFSFLFEHRGVVWAFYAMFPCCLLFGLFHIFVIRLVIRLHRPIVPSTDNHAKVN